MNTMRVCVRCNNISSYDTCCDHPTIPTYQSRPDLPIRTAPPGAELGDGHV